MIETTQKNIDFVKREYVEVRPVASYTLTAAWANATGYSLTLPVSGRYRIKLNGTIRITANITNNSGQLRLYNQTLGAAVAGSARGFAIAIGGSTSVDMAVNAACDWEEDFVAGHVITLQGYVNNVAVASILQYTAGSTEPVFSAALIAAYVNTIPSITSWQSYIPAITAAGGNPTKGTTVIDIAYYRRVADILEIIYKYRQTTAGVAGSGFYQWALPPSIVVDTNRCPYTTNVYMGQCGDGFAFSGSGETISTPLIYSASTWAVMSQTGATAGYISNSLHSLVNSSMIFSFNLRVPIII